MPRNARVVAPGIPHHVTQRGTNRQQVFFGIADRKLYLQLIRENLGEAGVRILAYCLMTKHVHFIAVPGREDSLAVLFGRAHGRYFQALNIRRGRCGHLWQARFHSCPMSGAHLQAGLRYVESNPRRAGLVDGCSGSDVLAAGQHRGSTSPKGAALKRPAAGSFIRGVRRSRRRRRMGRRSLRGISGMRRRGWITRIRGITIRVRGGS